MRAGSLRHRIKIWGKPAHNATGQPSIAYSVLIATNIPASVEGIRSGGGESLRGSQVSAVATTIVKVRYRKDVNPSVQIEHEGRRLGVVRAYDPTGRGVELICECREDV